MTLSALLNGRSLALVLAASLAFPPGLKAEDGHPAVHDSDGDNVAQYFQDKLADEIIGFTLKSPEPSTFEQKELLTILLRAGARRPDTRIDTLLDYSTETLPRHLLTEYYRQQFPVLNGRVTTLNAIFDIEKRTMGLVKAALKDQMLQLQRSGSFYWQSSTDRLQAEALIRQTNRQLKLWQAQARSGASGGPPWLDAESVSHKFKLGPAYQQLLDISQHGWGGALNWEPSKDIRSIRDPVAMPEEELSRTDKANTEQTDNYGDIDASLSEVSQNSDRAMQQYQNDVDSSGITSRLQGSAQENVNLVNHINDLEREAIARDKRILVKGVITGALLTGGAMALRSLSQTAISSPHGSFSSSAPSYASHSTPSHVFSAPRIGGSFDGGLGQTLFSR